ncbi:MAG TPA: ABC-F family ATP-binding cassette domain-containing protein, partial [Burkholderiaceae bacterium]|nr:ABC-F family ATP-binding cassette domain-containing protein [Burkholderiaceae bacterium]
MGILLSAQGLTAAYGARTLFEDVSFTIEDGDRVGLIGPNGAGKSTLLRLLADAAAEQRIGGAVSRRRGLRVGYLQQVPRFAPDATIASVVREGLAGGLGDALQVSAAAEAAEHGDWEREEQARQVMVALGFSGVPDKPDVDQTTPVASLSGGWQKRVALARELGRQPDLLLLDEPTNHLDVESIEWLERLLGRARFATVTVTHDRVFLQRVATRILELDRRNAGGLLAVDGNFEAYVRVKTANMEAQEQREVVLRNTLRRETEWLHRGAAARSTKQQARIQRAGDLREEVAGLGARNTVRETSLDFQGGETRARRLIEAKGLAKRYGDRTIFEGVDLLMAPGARVALMGPNGCGKSTLIRVLLGDEPASAGTVKRADGMRVSYFAQDRGALDPEMTVADTVCPDGDYVSFRGARVHVRGYLERFLFTTDQANLAVGKLSGGEQSRLLLAQLMLQPADILVLDEPTNDLDLSTLAVLEDALTEHGGAVLLVSHDRRFVDRVATHLLAFSSSSQQGAAAVVPFASLEQW